MLTEYSFRPFRFLTAALMLCQAPAQAQHQSFADSIRMANAIPELAYAVITADTVLESEVLGLQRAGTSYAAHRTDRFHLGSNTKAITAFIAATMVNRNELHWSTRFLELFPELKKSSRPAYNVITLQDLLTFRGRLPAYTYTFRRPAEAEIQGNLALQHYKLARYFLSRPPMQPTEGLTPSNADYILAGSMLEKASGKTYQALVHTFGTENEIAFGFGYPNNMDTLQPWGHDTALRPVPPGPNVKLNWLQAAGNINVSLPDYSKFIQLLLKGLKGQSRLLPAAVFERLLYGRPGFSFGWFNQTDTGTGHHVARNEGNAGAFITRCEVIKETGNAYIIFANAATKAAGAGIATLLKKLKEDNGD